MLRFGTAEPIAQYRLLDKERESTVSLEQHALTLHAAPFHPHAFDGPEGGDQVVCLALRLTGTAPRADVVGGRRSLRRRDPGHLGRVPAARRREGLSVKTGIPAQLPQAVGKDLPGLTDAR
ncbi:hypothetical protein GCM10010324_29110 [Streptomyces hiroshimensis]|uniref:Uncharacterized protein n=1 Tax=Streptomyces hiroshimensis TaxID=66424 RepID=A0ABQ2YF76_9ACTN|nr:hypothetical protein GCM10010324_29110 [Streptomyces hiroshimensis]